MKIMLTLQASIQNGIKQHNHINVKKRTPQISQARRPAFFSTRVIICLPHCGHVHCVGYSPPTNALPIYIG